MSTGCVGGQVILQGSQHPYKSVSCCIVYCTSGFDQKEENTKQKHRIEKDINVKERNVMWRNFWTEKKEFNYLQNKNYMFFMCANELYVYISKQISQLYIIPVKLHCIICLKFYYICQT